MESKKIIGLIALCVVAVLLGIGVFAVSRGPAENAETQKEQAAAEQGEQAETEDPAEAAEETEALSPSEVALAMSNHNDEGLFLVDGDQVYYSSFDTEGRAMLVRSKMDGSDQKTVREDCDASYLTKYNDKLYMIIWTTDEGSALCSMDMDGSNFTSIVTGAVDLQIAEGKLFYNKVDTSNEYEVVNGGYFNAELDGSGESQLLDKETYDNYVVDGKIYYQDEKDDQHIHAMDLETQEDKQITKTHSHGFVVDGEKAYYIDTGDDGDATTGNLTQLDLKTGDSAVIAGEAYKDDLVVRENTILYCDGENNYHLSQLDKGESGKKEIADINNPDYVYASGEKILFFDYDWNWQYVEGVYCINGEGNMTRLDE